MAKSNIIKDLTVGAVICIIIGFVLFWVVEVTAGRNATNKIDTPELWAVADQIALLHADGVDVDGVLKALEKADNQIFMSRELLFDDIIRLSNISAELREELEECTEALDLCENS